MFELYGLWCVKICGTCRAIESPDLNGHRKIAALMRADGDVVSTSTVERALRRRGLLLPRGFRADRKSWAAIRRRVFRDAPTEQNRVWQMEMRAPLPRTHQRRRRPRRPHATNFLT
jgi:hypothetical protein